nr:MFS transporter [Rhodococcus pseudokoreensis]
MCFCVGGTVVYYVWAVAAPAFAISERGIDPTSALWAGSIATVLFMIALPFWGALSDRIGRRPVLLVCFGALVILMFPLNWMIRDDAWQLFAAMSTALIFVAGLASITPAVGLMAVSAAAVYLMPETSGISLDDEDNES